MKEGVLTVKLVNLPALDTSTVQVMNRLVEFLKRLRLRRFVEEAEAAARRPRPLGPAEGCRADPSGVERREWRRFGRTRMQRVHPGVHLADAIEELGLTQYRLAKTINVPPGRMNEIIRGRRAISPETSVRLGQALGMSSTYWLDQQRKHDNLAGGSPGRSDHREGGPSPVGISERDLQKIERRANELVRRREAANGLGHLREDEKRALKRIYGDVPAVRVPTEHRADEIAAALHEEMP